MADLIDYIFRFSNQGDAVRDPVVGPFFNNKAGTPLEILVFADVSVDSVESYPGFWCMINKAGDVDPAFANHPNIEIVNNRTLYLAQQASVISTNIPIDHIEIIINIYGVYVLDGLGFKGGPIPPPPITPDNGYITEDAIAFYVAEDGATFYVQEI